MPSGTEIWAEDEADGGDEVWMLAEVLRQDNTMLTVRKKRTGEELAIDLGFGETYPPNPKVVADMTSLHHIHEAGILHNLRERSKLQDQRPYTFMGTILIAVNPLRRVPNPEMTDYMDRSLNPETPHPYAIAELAYHQMRLGAGRKVANQSIVVSGESGAGKTETSKIILTFLTHRSVGGVASLDQKVVDSSPILESFGNAKTLRNNNSSRFGKFLKLQFTKDKYRLAGAFIETYLLEKSRVLTQGKGERNFHILYQLVAGASGVGIDLKLQDVESYKILSQSDCTTLDDVDDAAEFRTVKGAFDTIGMGEESQLQVWQMLASVLHLSNVEFDKVDHEQGEIATISDREALSTLAALLAVEESALEAMLTQRVVVTRGETFTKQLSAADANLTRDAIVKSLYEALFLWIVSVINTSLGKGEDSLPFIGVLDIFGFENFDTKNEFEQLLINFTNESLQDTFNKQVFNNELKLYEEEGIDVVVSTCPDNAECILMLSTKPKGIIPSLDNVCAEPNPSDARYLDGLHKTYARHQDFPRTQPRDMRENFWVKHYAGKVKYTVEGWVERNMDRIPESFGGTLAASTHAVVRASTSMYGQPPTGAAAKAKPTRSRKTLVKPTVAKAFLASMQDLNMTLLSTTCNFIRCIKPNAAMKCGVFNNRYVVEQLQCLGILQTCEVLKVGMPTRVTYTELKEVLGENAAQAEKLFEGEPETALIAGILWAFEVPSEVFRLGRTRVFFRAGQISTLQKILNETGPEKGPWIFDRLQQALANRHKAKKAAKEAKAAVDSALAAVMEAQEMTTKAIGAEQKDEDGAATRPPPESILSDDDEYKLESAVKKARIAGNSIPQVKLLIQAAKEDEIGTYVVGAFERVMTASEEATKTIQASSTKAEELDVLTRTAKGGDAAQEIRKLEDSLKRLRRSFQETKDLATGAEEAAAKCQVEKTQERVEETKRKASGVAVEAAAVVSGAKGIAQAAERQLQALSKANDLLPSVNAATEEALTAFSSFKNLIAETSKKETAAKEASDAKAEAEAAARRQQATAKARMESTKSSMKNLSLSASDADDHLAALPSAAPGRGQRGRMLKKQASQSVKNLLDTVGTPDTSVSPNRKMKSDEDNVSGPAVVGPGPGGMMFGGGARAFKEMFEEAMKGGCVEGHLMKQSKYFSRWKPRYFRLEDGYLTYYDKKSLVGTNKNKGMELTAHSITSYTNTKNCFCVRTGEAVWFLLGKDELALNKWMTAINAQIHGLFIKLYNVPEDNYWSQGTNGRFFYRMVDDALPQWIRTYPEQAAPRTGDGLFPGEVIEVAQTLTNKETEFLRIGNDRGWTYAKNPADGSTLFEEIDGEVVPDTRNYGFPPSAKDPIPLLFGPGLESQQTGEALIPGERAEAMERFTPGDGSGVVFIKLKDGRGWVPVRKRNGSFGVTPTEL
ncbi:conserved unknown protein [Ectocarpus siliculosus]|uniref:Uncharacterized protein n=1 Tax=Ectocarpus siliculosus TaxID=2880 RepID=D7FPQ0_ECTSI|nr:conserved unknown protein [Ectocarpus siliculosus]|eukprot:CBJ30507.1 conserved unknown protein [Ectocarpus siliculosus]